MWYFNVYQLNPVQFNTNADVSEFVFICTYIHMSALKMLMFHWKQTRAVHLLHVKCCKNMQTQPHRCHETLNSYKTNVFLIQSTILFFMQFSSDIVKNSPSDEAFCLVRFNFPVCCCFTSMLWGTSFLCNCLLILWKFLPLMKPFIAWWGCPVDCVFCLFHKPFWRKAGIKHNLRMLAYLSFT